MPKRVLSVGQCGPDTAALSRFLTQHFQVELVAAQLPDDAFERLAEKPFDLVLVNRKLDADYSDGIDVLKAIKSDPRFNPTPVMVVSNYPETHDEAVAAGGERGFGKLEYSKPETVNRLRRFLG
jgi:CheY-like chemotaxis protein